MMHDSQSPSIVESLAQWTGAAAFVVKAQQAVGAFVLSCLDLFVALNSGSLPMSTVRAMHHKFSTKSTGCEQNSHSGNLHN